MNYILKILRFHIPEYIKNKKLSELFRLTADAFGIEPPGLRGLPFSARLAKYAEFTKEQAERALKWEGSPEERKSRLDAVEGKLYQSSLLFGRDLRKSLKIDSRGQALEALELVYRIIGIDFRCGARDGSQCAEPNGFTVSECFFSSYYSAEVCRLISLLDTGLAAGLTGCGELGFTQRITEGYGCCKGYFDNIDDDRSKRGI